MATESVKILIEAEDKATAKLKQAVSEQEKAAAKAELSRVRAQKSLAAERIELEQGAEAAHAFRLELEGMEAAEAALIAREKELLNQQKKRAAEQQKLSEIGGAKQTKSGAEFFGAIAGIAGGSEIASIAGQIGGLTEKTSQFGEVAKMGGANAMLFKAGLVAAAGAIGYQVGSAIGNVVFQTEKFNAELEKSVANLAKLEQVQLGQLRDKFSDFKIDLEFAPDKDAAVADQIAQLKAELNGYEMSAKAARGEVAKLEAQGQLATSSLTTVGMIVNYKENIDYLKTYTGDFKALLAEKQRELEFSTTKSELMREEIAELEKLVTIEKERDEKRAQKAEEKQSADYLQSLRDDLEMVKAEMEDKAAELKAKAGGGTFSEDEANRILSETEAAKKVFEEQQKAGKANELKAQRGAGGTFENDEALRLISEIEASKKALEQQQKLQQQKEQEAEKEKQRAKSIEDLKQRELDKLEEEATLLSKGKEAAHALRLEKMGIAKEDAERIAAAQAELDVLDEQNKKKESAKASSLNATESRLLTRGPEQDATVKTAEHTKKTAEAAAAQLSEIRKLREQMKPKDNVITLETVGKS